MSGVLNVEGQLHEREQEIASRAGAKLRPSLDFSGRIPELDGLRGVAIGLVVFLHCVTFAIMVRPPHLLGYVYVASQLFWSGVDLFFVLSGFLIGGILLDARESPKYFSTFYMRRLCRIVPIYLLFIILVGIAYRFVYLRVGAPLDGTFAGPLPWYAYLSFAQNFWMAKFNTGGQPILSITWSLAVEEQFYLVLPLLIRFVRRSALPYVYIAGIVIAPLVRILIAHQFQTDIWAGYVLLPCRMDSLFLGALCAYGVREPKIWNWLVNRRRSLWIMFFALLAGLPFLNALLITLNDSLLKGGPPASLLPLALWWTAIGFGWIAFFYATALILALTDSQSLLSRAMRWKSLASLGAIAYSVYLFHVGIYCFCNFLFLPHGWPLRSWSDFGVTLIALAITFTFGKLSWRYFEKPIVRWGHSFQY